MLKSCNSIRPRGCGWGCYWHSVACAVLCGRHCRRPPLTFCVVYHSTVMQLRVHARRVCRRPAAALVQQLLTGHLQTQAHMRCTVSIGNILYGLQRELYATMICCLLLVVRGGGATSRCCSFADGWTGKANVCTHHVLPYLTIKTAMHESEQQRPCAADRKRWYSQI